MRNIRGPLWGQPGVMRLFRKSTLPKILDYLEASATAADPSSFNVIRRLIGKGQVTPAKHTWG